MTDISSSPCILAAIDIGTNSIHMVVVRINPALAAFTIIAKEKDTVRLGDRDPKTGNLTTEAMERSLATLRRCKDLAESLQAEQIIAVATSATREANNGQEFLQQIASETGIFVNLISGQEEARRIYLGVLSGMDFHNQPQVIIDIGGGSTELILADSHEPRFLSSTKVGAVRLSQAMVTSDPISDLELNVLRAYVRGMLERPVDEMRLEIKPGETLRLVGTSGTIETLATIHALEKFGEVPSPLQGYTMSRKDLKEMLNSLARMTIEQRMMIPGMSDRRAEIIVAGGVVLLEAMSLLKLDQIIICERALREGMIVDWMLSHGLIESRLQLQSKVRERSVLKIAHKYRVDLDHSRRVANFSLILFDRLQGQLHHWGAQERQYLWAAAILHNAGVYISHSSHHKHSYYLIRHAELLGFSEMELEAIANIARYHRKSTPKKKHLDYSKLPDNIRKLIKQLSALLRLAVALDRRQIGAIQSLECSFDSEYKKLHLHLIPANPDDDCALEMWNLAYKKNVFEAEFGVSLMATIDHPITQLSTV